MQPGLSGRRTALFVTSADKEGPASVIRRTLEMAGAQVQELQAGQGAAEDWHGARYAALVIVGDREPPRTKEPKLVQLTRELLVSEKPVAAFGGAVSVLVEAGAAGGRTLAVDRGLQPAVEAAGGRVADQPIHADNAFVTARGDADAETFAKRVVSEFSEQLEEHALDEMSEQSFPASDPPTTTPPSMGKAAPKDREPDSRT